MFLTGPQVVARGDGRGRATRRARRPEGARAQRRRALRRRATTPTRRCSCATCSTTCRSDRAPSARRAGAPPARPATTRRAGARPSARKVYDVRDVVARVVDGGRLLEYRAALGAQHRLRRSPASTGRPVGVIANQPHYLGGVLDAESAAKAARFVRTCNAFGLPLVVLVDTPGFMPGTQQEQARRDPPRRQARARVRRGDRAEGDRRAAQGVRRRVHRDELARPRRRLPFAWPQARARRDGRRARPSAIVHRREIAAADDPAPRATRSPPSYADEHLTAGIAAARGLHRRGHRPRRHAPAARRGAVHPRRDRRPGGLRPQHPAVNLDGRRPPHGGRRSRPRWRGDRTAARQEAPHNRRPEPRLDRVRGRAPGPGGGRRGRAHRLRPRQAPDRAGGQPPAAAGGRARARRQQPRATSTAVATDLGERWGRVDGVLHAIAFAPEDALGGSFLDTPPESAVTAFHDQRVLA